MTFSFRASAALPALLGALLTLAACGGEEGPTAEDKARAKASESAASASASASAAASASASQSAEQQAEYDECSAGATDLLDALKDLNSRLGVGLSYADYGEKVGDVQVAYDDSVEAILASSEECVAKVGTPLENAVNRYREVHNLWSDCIDDYNCDFSEGAVNDKVQNKWAAATNAIDRAEKNLLKLAP